MTNTTGYTHQELLKKCKQLAKEQNIVFRRSESVKTIDNKACYELESGLFIKL